MLQLTTVNRVLALWASVGAFLIAGAFLLTYFQPDRNRMTVLIARYMEAKYVRGLSLPPKPSLLAVGIVCFLVGVLALLMSLTASMWTKPPFH